MAPPIAAPAPHHDAVAAQYAALVALYRNHVGAGEAYALVDFPDHANVGDSAIWLGERALLRHVTGRDPAYVCTWQDFDAAAFRRACPTGVLFLHGGGNLGDIWIHHQQFREHLVDTVTDRRVVQLPQSIHFRDPARADRFTAIVARHPDFHLCVRDEPGLRFARARFACPVTLAPDSAFGLGVQPRPAPPTDAVLMLLRTDDERAGHDRAMLAAHPGAVLVDWLEDGAMPLRDAGTDRTGWYDRIATARVRRGLALLSRGERVVTDRLHGHILALLLDIPHVALDNDYGKVSAYIAAWTAASPRVRTARSAIDALGALA